MKEQYKPARMPIRAFGAATAAVVATTVGGIGPATAATPPPTAAVTGDTLTITGTPGDDTIELAFTLDNTVNVDLGDGGPAHSFDRRTFVRVSVRLLGGDDRFHTSTAASQDLRETVEGGPGDDQILGGFADDLIVGDGGDDVLLGGGGTDVLFGNLGDDEIDGGIGSDTELLGAGDDIALWNPGEGNDAVIGDTGRDTLVFNGSNAAEAMTLSAIGDGAVFTRNVGGIRMDLQDVERLDLATLGGVDTVRIDDLRGTGLSTTAIDLSAAGATDGDDTVTLNGSERGDRVSVSAIGDVVDVDGPGSRTLIGGADPTDVLAINTLGGNDRVRVTDAARALIAITTDLGARR